MTSARETEAGEVIVAGVTRLEEKDVYRAHWRIPPALNPLVRGLAFSSLLMLVGLVWSVLGLSMGEPLALLPGAIIAGFGAWIGWIAWRQPGVGLRALPEWERQVRFELAERRLRVRTEKTAIEIDWELYVSCQETEHAFHLERQGPQFQVIPKHAFEESEIPLVRATLQERVREQPRLRARSSSYRTPLVWLVLIAFFTLIYQLVTR